MVGHAVPFVQSIGFIEAPDHRFHALRPNHHGRILVAGAAPPLEHHLTQVGNVIRMKVGQQDCIGPADRQSSECDVLGAPFTGIDDVGMAPGDYGGAGGLPF